MIVLIFTEQPLVLLVIGSAFSAIVMFIYSILLIVLNRGNLPQAIKLRGYRLAIMCFAVVWFGYFSTRVIIEYGGSRRDRPAGADSLLLLAVTIWFALIGLARLVTLVA